MIEVARLKTTSLPLVYYQNNELRPLIAVLESTFQTFCGLCAFSWLAGRQSVQWTSTKNWFHALREIS